MAVLYFIGLMLIILDGKFLGDGTMAVIGGILMIISLALPSPDILYGVCVGAAFVIGAACSLAFLKFFPKRDLWSKMTLKHSLTSEKGYNSINEGYKSLIGQEGEAFTRFNPTGTIRIDGQNYSATSQGVWIEKGSRIKVIQVTGTHILIEKVESGEDTEDV